MKRTYLNFILIVKIISICISIALVFFIISPKSFATAGINRTINFQGKVVNKTTGVNVTNGNYDFTFKLYSVASGGSPIWTENFTGGNQLAVTDGIFRAPLGSITTFASIPVDFNSDSLYLDITFNTETMGSRVQFTSVPYAFNAEKVSGLTVTNNGGNTLNIAANKTLTVSDSTTLNTNTITLGGGEVITFSATNALSLLTTGATSVTLPTGGTLLTNTAAANQTVTSTQTSGNVLSVADSTGLSSSITGLTIGLTSSTNSQNKTGISFDLSGGSSGTYYDLLGTGSTWSITRAGALTVASCSGCGGAGGTNYWNLVSGNGVSNGGYITPINSTADFFLGGQATTSAKFAVLNLNGGTPVASIAGNLVIGQGAQLRSEYGALQLAYKSAPDTWTTGLYIQDTTGNVSIGTTPSTIEKLKVAETKTNTSGFVEMQYNVLDANPAGASSATFIGMRASAQSKSGNGQNFTGTIVSFYNDTLHLGTGTLANAYGVQGFVGTGSTGTITTAQAFRAREVSDTAAGNTVTYTGFYAANPAVANGATIGTTYGLQIEGHTTGGTANYGARIDAASTQTLWLSGNADNTTAAAGIAFGASKDTNLYRSAPNTLRTDNAFNVNGNANISSTGVVSGLTGVTLASGAITLQSSTGTGQCITGGATASWGSCGGGGLQTPWISDIDADGYDLTDLSNIEFRTTTGAPAGTIVSLYSDNTGDLNLNALTGKAINLQVNGSDEFNFSSSELNANNNIITNIGNVGTDFDTSGGLTLAADIAVNGGDITSSASVLNLQVAGTGSTGNVQIGAGGAGSSTPDLLVLDVKSTAGDPTGTNGAMYYNTDTQTFRCYENDAWKNCSDGGKHRYYAEADFLAASWSQFEDPPWVYNSLNSGTKSSQAGDANHPGVIRGISSTTVNSGARWVTEANAILIVGRESNEIIFRLPLLDSGTTIRMGFHDTSTSSAPTDGAWINIVNSTLDGRTANNSTSSTTGTSYTVSASTWYRAKIVVNSDATRVDFYLYDDSGTQLWTNNLTTNIPTSAGRETGNSVVASNSGTSAVNLIDLDYMNLTINRLLARGGSGADLAEIYYSSDESIVPGDVVALDPAQKAVVQKSATSYDRNVLGIISEQPGLVLEKGDDRPEGMVSIPVALAGRVPVKVSSENGEIKPGDYITSSSKPGVAMKATKSGVAIGQAMEGYNKEGVGKILVFIKSVSYQGSIAESFSNIATHSDTYSQDILNALREQNNIAGNSDILARLASGQEQDGLVSEINTDRIIAGLEIISPKIVTDLLIAKTIRADQIEGLELLVGKIKYSDSMTNFSTSTKSAVLGDSIKLLDAVSLVSLDSNGLATVSADLNVKGNNVIEGILTVLKSIATPNLLVSDFASFFGDVIFKKNISVEGTATFNSDTAGFAVVNKDADTVKVEFDNEYLSTPVITASIALDKSGDNALDKKLEDIVLNGNITYVITQRTTKGFVIKLNQTAPSDINFSWVALSVKNANTHSSNTNKPSVSTNPEATKSAAFQSILNQLNSQNNTQGGT